MYRPTYLEVNCDTLKNNIIEIKKNYPDYKYYFGVIKANAYGHGFEIINSLISGGINYFAVSSLEEALEARKYNSDVPILILEPIKLDYIDICISNNITITISNIDYYLKLLNFNLSNKLKIHIKLDTGMSRLGIKKSEELNTIINTYKQNSNLFLEGIYTHFATSGILDKHWDNQLECFKKITKDIDLSLIPIIHMGRSLTLVNHPKIEFCNGTRLGIIMYGMSQSMPQSNDIKSKIRNYINKRKIKKYNISPTTTTNNLNLKTAITLYSEVLEIRKIEKNNFVGYGANYISDDTSYVATIPIGYADGIPKEIKHVSINNKLYHVIGDICMDMITVKIDSTVQVGDTVILLGDNILTVKKVSRECNTNSYTIFTKITNRVPRVYINK